MQAKLWRALLLGLLMPGLLSAGGRKPYSLRKSEVGYVVETPDGRTVFQYMTVKPEGSRLTANSTCCFYPVMTPGGTRVVDFAPDDHPHHRGPHTLIRFNILAVPKKDLTGVEQHCYECYRDYVHQSDDGKPLSKNAVADNP